MKLRARVVPLLLPLAVGAVISVGVLDVHPARGLASANGLGAMRQRHANVIREIETRYVRDLDPETLARATVSGMLSRLDPHSNLFVPRNYRQMRERQQGGYVGLGIRVQQQNGLLTVVSPFEGTPAYRLGIRAGDDEAKPHIALVRMQPQSTCRSDPRRTGTLSTSPESAPNRSVYSTLAPVRFGSDRYAPRRFAAVRFDSPDRSASPRSLRDRTFGAKACGGR